MLVTISTVWQGDTCFAAGGGLKHQSVASFKCRGNWNNIPAPDSQLVEGLRLRGLGAATTRRHGSEVAAP